MSGFTARFIRSHPRIRGSFPADAGVRFSAEELVRYAGPAQMVLSSHDAPRRHRSGNAGSRPAHAAAAPWAQARKRSHR